jgi:uncharacterized protein YeaO (DUF488 family)
MNTSYFAHYKGQNGIAITAYKPKFWNGPVYSSLAPSKDLLNRYKSGQVTDEQYVVEFKAHLSTLDTQKVWSDVGDKVLLCYETADKFCHRHLVAAWIRESLGHEVLEI